MLRLKHLEELARVTRNFAQMATTAEERHEFLAMAVDYKRRAQLRREAIASAETKPASSDPTP